MNDRRHLHLTDVRLFDEVEELDWNDLRRAGAIAERLLRSFANDKALFRTVLLAVKDDPYLWSKCEEDVVEDKIVLWDDKEKGLRLRLRMSTAPQERLAHSHRFSFSNLVLHGSYLHWAYDLRGSFNETTRPDDFVTLFVHEDRAGDCFTIHHDALHSTPFAQPETVSLVLRGNPVKRRAPVMFKEKRTRRQAFQRAVAPHGIAEVEPAQAKVGDLFWRVGEEDESVERRAERQMSADRYQHWCNRLAELGII
jgi:hypothetical protein